MSLEVHHRGPPSSRHPPSLSSSCPPLLPRPLDLINGIPPVVSSCVKHPGPHVNCHSNNFITTAYCMESTTFQSLSKVVVVVFVVVGCNGGRNGVGIIPPDPSHALSFMRRMGRGGGAGRAGRGCTADAASADGGGNDRIAGVLRAAGGAEATIVIVSRRQ